MELAGHTGRLLRMSVRVLLAVTGLVALGLVVERPVPVSAQLCPPGFPAGHPLCAPPVAVLQLTKTHLPLVVGPGQTLTYTITVRNPSLTTAVTNASVIDSLPPGFVLTSGSATGGGICGFGTAVSCYFLSIPANTTYTITLNGVVSSSPVSSYLNAVSYVTPTGPVPTGTATDFLYIATGELTADDPTFTRPSSGSTAANCALGAAGVRYDTYVIQHPGGTLRVDDAGSPTGNGTLTDPFVVVYSGGPGTRGGGFNPASPCTNLLGADDDGGTGLNSRLVLNNLPAGTYTIVATAFASTNLGTYVVNATASTPSGIAAAEVKPSKPEVPSAP